MIEETITRLEEKSIEKSPTGINGLDEVTSSGLPKGRPAIVIGVQALKTLKLWNLWSRELKSIMSQESPTL